MTLREYLSQHASQTDLATRAGISQPSLSNFLRGKRGLRPTTIAKIVAATGGLVSHEELINEIVELHANRRNHR